ncbi:hypothetical protein [Curtobacterium sp. MCPF17_052]|uniref:hypothetical protein n=1 Tax=Curtobacterium sp. MCPF17_052 TaxID=2175655 RepID=UPI0015E8827A|nr:hypothetical protein [Curtobacterium sp. MCPF17_052]WIB12903.1 hypothetical protein DEJ36_02440 [Curtobacterium sp. MCPF17_052]
MNEYNRTKVALALVVIVGVLIIVVGTVVSGTSAKHEKPRECPYTSGCAYSTVK